MPLPFQMLQSSGLMVCAAALAMAAMPPAARAQATLAGLAGNWSGGGQVRLSDGRSERLSCRAYYTPREGGMGIALRCASQSYKIELRSALQVNGSRVSGTWEERSFNASGAISGSSSAGSLKLAFNGTTSGSIAISYADNNQLVSISTTGEGGMASVSLNLSKGT